MPRLGGRSTGKGKRTLIGKVIGCEHGGSFLAVLTLNMCQPQCHGRSLPTLNRWVIDPCNHWLKASLSRLFS